MPTNALIHSKAQALFDSGQSQPAQKQYACPQTSLGKRAFYKKSVTLQNPQRLSLHPGANQRYLLGSAEERADT